ncbi:MAG: IS66 family transposase zinc-finger binding domain-containing protein [Eubacteriales bacterium]
MAPKPDERTLIPPHERKKKRSKEKLTEGLPNYQVLCDLPENEQSCLKCGNKMVYIGKEKIRSELLLIPPQMAVLNYYQLSYKCVTCEKETGETYILKGDCSSACYEEELGFGCHSGICDAGKVL